MKNLLYLATLSLFIISCSNSKKNSIDSLIESNNIEALKQMRSQLQADLSKIDLAVSASDTIEETILVTTKTVNDTVFNHYIEVQGNVMTKENIIIYPQFSGNLTALYVKAGQKVNKGQILARIDDGGLSSQLAQIEAQFELAKTTYEKQKNLWDQKIGSEIQYLQAQTQMTSLQKSVAQIKTQLSKTVVIAPFSGDIEDINVETGQIVSPALGLMRIVSLKNMYISTSVPESTIGKLNTSTLVDVNLPSLGKTYQGKVRQLDNYINPSNRSFSLEINVPNTDNLLRPNQIAKLKINDYTNNKAIVVPSNIIQQDASGNNYVYISINSNNGSSVAKKAIIKTGANANNVTEVLDGLHLNDTIIVEGYNNLSEGMSLKF